MAPSGEAHLEEVAGAREDAQAVLDALAARPGGAELLAAGAQGAEIALVGGAVRDLLTGRQPRELDVVAGGGTDVAALAQQLARRLGGATETTLHERFDTAVVRWDGGRIDIARRRAESYPQPGALPVVREGTAAEDLRRRDFTVNALAVELGGDRRGELTGAERAIDDLRAGRLRVLHDASFRDDPTRLLRLGRYGARLGMAVEEHTAALAAAALADGVLATVSGARVGAELRLALAEAGALDGLAALSELGVLRAIDPCLAFDEGRARRALELLPTDESRATLLLATLLPAPGAREVESAAGRASPSSTDLWTVLDRLAFAAGERDVAIAAATGAGALAAQIAAARRPSQLHALLADCSPEAVALAGADADGGAAAGASEWLSGLRHVRLQITGDDLLAAGVPQGPEIGARLTCALRLRLDGELADGREAELDAALAAVA